MSNKYCIIIPARYESSRLPGKPLIDLNGLPMIVRTFKQCVKVCNQEIIYVATDDKRIKEVCLNYGIQVLMTSSDHLTGTDRIAECASILEYDNYINVQGDEPVFNPVDLKMLISRIDDYPNKILNGYCSIDCENDFRNYSVPKVVINSEKKLLYMSRASIPGSKDNLSNKAWRQVCLYSFPKESLDIFKKNKTKTPLESIEDIEILRFLELGYEVIMLEMSSNSIPIDHEEDISKVMIAIKERNL